MWCDSSHLTLSNVLQKHPEVDRQIAAAAFGSCQVQVLRSTGKWSVGESTEQSIQNAYVEAIKSAHHLIYIENQVFSFSHFSLTPRQFFIGSPEISEGEATEGMPQNLIISALYQRICKAIEQEEHFRVIVLLPQHPSGDFLNHESPRIIYHYEYTTICR